MKIHYQFHLIVFVKCCFVCCKKRALINQLVLSLPTKFTSPILTWKWTSIVLPRKPKFGPQSRKGQVLYTYVCHSLLWLLSIWRWKKFYYSSRLWITKKAEEYDEKTEPFYELSSCWEKCAVEVLWELRDGHQQKPIKKSPSQVFSFRALSQSFFQSIG